MQAFQVIPEMVLIEGQKWIRRASAGTRVGGKPATEQAREDALPVLVYSDRQKTDRKPRTSYWSRT